MHKSSDPLPDATASGPLPIDLHADPEGVVVAIPPEVLTRVLAIAATPVPVQLPGHSREMVAPVDMLDGALKSLEAIGRHHAIATGFYRAAVRGRDTRALFTWHIALQQLELERRRIAAAIVDVFPGPRAMEFAERWKHDTDLRVRVCGLDGRPDAAKILAELEARPGTAGDIERVLGIGYTALMRLLNDHEDAQRDDPREHPTTPVESMARAVREEEGIDG
jgi:hypothetical protein